VDRLTCEQVFHRLDDYVDRELAPGEAELVRQHLEVCAWCAGEYHFEKNVVDQVRGKLRRIELPSSLMKRISVLLTLESEGDPPPRSERREA
jgi:anti-sigma factor (TIGR02949 family)